METPVKDLLSNIKSVLRKHGFRPQITIEEPTQYPNEVGVHESLRGRWGAALHFYWSEDYFDWLQEHKKQTLDSLMQDIDALLIDADVFMDFAPHWGQSDGHLFNLFNFAYDVEGHVYDLQAEYICNEFGQEAMEKANYGAGADEGCIETKVYGYGKLTTNFNPNATNADEVNADHDFEYDHKEEEE